MYIAQSKRKENIAEYILYLWQLEDLLRAMQFSPEAIYSQLADRFDVDPERKQELLLWYVEVGNLLRQEGKEQHGHLEHTLHLIGDLQNLHTQLLTLKTGERYRTLWAKVAPELPALREKLGKEEVGDIELCFRVLYAVMLQRIKAKTATGTYAGTLELISPLIAELASFFGAAERGEIDLYRDAE